MPIPSASGFWAIRLRQPCARGKTYQCEDSGSGVFAAGFRHVANANPYIPTVRAFGWQIPMTIRDTTNAEDRGFEPLRAFTQHAFQACAIGH